MPLHQPMEPDRRDRPGNPAVSVLLRLGTPREILARIVPEDALGLRARLAERLMSRSLLVDAERVLLRAQALCALLGASWRGEPELEEWLDQRVEEALAGILAEESASLEAFARPLALDPRALGRACASFNRLAIESREAFVALVLESREPDRFAARQGLSLSEIARRARAGLEPFRRATAEAPRVGAERPSAVERA